MNPILFPLYLASILCSVIAAIIYRRGLEQRLLLVMIPYLLLVFTQELTLGILSQLKYYTHNAFVHNIYRLVNVIVFAYIYYRIPFMKPLRKLILVITGAYLTTALVNYFFIESIFSTSTYLVLARGFVITFFAVLFLFRYFNLDNLEQEKYWMPHIWITIGVATFYPVISISLSFQKYLAADKLFGLKVYQAIPQVMSIFMYSCFSYAFYLCQKKKWIS